MTICRKPFQARHPVANSHIPTTVYINWFDPKCLTSLYKKDPAEITLTLEFEIETVKHALRRCIDDKDLCLSRIWLGLISNTLMCRSMPSSLQTIFNTVTDEGLALFVVNEFLTNDDPIEVTESCIQDSTECLISICTRAFELFPDKLSALLGLYELILALVSSFHSKQSNRCLSNMRTSKIYTTFSCLTEMKCSLLRQWIKPCSLDIAAANSAAEDDKHFRDISIVPKPYRINILAQRSAHLKANIIKGPFDYLDQYLDVHFRLLREEFMSPLRNGLQQYLDSISADDKRQRNPFIRVYKEVCIIAPVVKKELMFTVTFNVSRMQRINWEYSKRLLHGALVCLSSDNFKTMHFGTIAERDPCSLKRGITRVRFEKGIKTINWLEDKSYIMIERTGLFEAYRHVLCVLQSLNGTLPFANYILKCRSNVDVPRYLRGKKDIKFDLTPLLEKTVCIFENKLGIFNDDEITHERMLHNLNRSSRTSSPDFARNIDIMDFTSWPSYEMLNLDESQFRALQTSLTKELVIIQGPPGTGKSFIGLQIVKILLKNQHAWLCRVEEMTLTTECRVSKPQDTNENHEPESLDSCQNDPGCSKAFTNPTKQDDPSTPTEVENIEPILSDDDDMRSEAKEGSVQETQSETFEQTPSNSSSPKVQSKQYIGHVDPRPILIVCYTNHALDQFVEGILQFYKGDVLRVGGRSQSKLLEPHSLSSVRRNIWLSKALRVSIKNAHNETFNLRKRLVTAAIETDILNRNIIHLESLDILTYSAISKLKENYYRWTVNDEEYCRRQGYTKLINPSDTVIWLELFRKLDEIAKCYRNRAQVSVRKIKKVQVQNKRHNVSKQNKLYDISNETNNIVESIMDELLNKVHVAYDPQNFLECEHGIQREFANYIKAQLESNDMMTDEEVDYYSNDICVVPLNARWRMYRKFMENRRKEIAQDTKRDLIKLEKACAKQKELELQKDKAVMQKATIIGMTTTCAAKYHAILNEVKPRIIIIEEAAEVLESHIISSLNPSCDQMILIGDHKQLRPKVETYDLASRYHLDVSLFERMVKNGIHYDCLEVQHRMRPIIADVSRHIYPNLKDHKTVELYPNIGGVAHNLFCVSHSFEETYNDEQRSYSNDHEAKFAVALAKYIIQQGYDASRVTVLTTYKGQLFLLKRLLKDEKKDLQNITVTVVDNYQGEENDIVILSLVRSNEKGRIGFLNETNRICVALSRAKMGLYIIGDIVKLAGSSPLWIDIMMDLQNKSVIGKCLPLYCQNHSTEKVYASSHEDFRQVPEGGCQKPCECRLDCGHVCERKCHIVNSNHEGIICRKQCVRRCENGHRCMKKCNESCGKCNVTILITLKCGHMNAIPCHKDIDSYICDSVCNKPLDCGHICKKRCIESCFPCPVTYKASLLRCKHEVDIICGVSTLPSCQLKCGLKLECGHDCKEVCKKTYYTESQTENEVTCDLGHKIICQERCDAVLACKHRCSGTCSTCFGKRLHSQCSKKCNCDLACGHTCEGTCGECFPCERNCEKSCPHGRCQRRCKEPCEKCDEACKWNWSHFKCTAVCGDPCNRPRCNISCMKVLKCGHKCIGLCGEPCPGKCLTCNSPFLKKIGILSNENQSPRVVELEECRHIVEYRQMDKYMDEKEEVVRLKRCPVCTKPIRRSTRYGNIVKEIIQKIEMLKINVMKVVRDDDLAWSKINRNKQSIQICLEKINAHFNEGESVDAGGLNDHTFLENVVLGNNNNQRHINTISLSNKQFVLDTSLEIRRCFDIAVLKQLETRIASASISSDTRSWIKRASRIISLKKRYDADMQEVIAGIIAKLRSVCHGVRQATLEIKIVEIDPAVDEAHTEENSTAETNSEQHKILDENIQQGLVTEKHGTEKNTDEPIVFQLQLFIRKKLPYYNCGKHR